MSPVEASRSRRGKGCLRDPADVVRAEILERPVGQLLAVRRPVIVHPSCSWVPYVETIPDQGATEACVGHAFATSLHVRSLLAGSPIARPSAKGIYDVARLLDRPGQPLVDVGCSPSAALHGMARFGLVAEERWPTTEGGIDERPPLDVFTHGLGSLLSGWYRIASGPGAAEGVRAALAAGHVPVFAMDVDEAYEDHDGADVVRALAGPVVGRHMQALVGYGPEGFTVAGSWGRAWGRGGYAVIAEELLESPACDGFIVPTLLPLQVT